MANRPPDDKPALVFELRNVVCSLHGEMFRKDWPRGYAVFSALAIDVIFKHTKFLEACRGDVTNAQKLLNQIPICCRLPKDQLLRLYEVVSTELDMWRPGICDICHDVARGGQMMRHVGAMQSDTIPHVCLRCLVYRIQDIKAN